MYLYDNKQFKDLREIHANYDLISIGEIMKSCGASVGPVSIALNNLAIKPEIITLKPSGRTIQLYQRKELPVIAKVVGSVFQNDVVPDNYISKREFAVMFGVKPYTVNNMSAYFKDFDKYAKYYFVDNIKTKFYLINEVINISRPINIRIEPPKIEEVPERAVPNLLPSRIPAKQMPNVTAAISKAQTIA
jgi:hypothetical protein